MNAGRISWCLIPLAAFAAVGLLSRSWSESDTDSCEDETSFAQSILVATRLAGPARQRPMTASLGSFRDPADLLQEDMEVLPQGGTHPAADVEKAGLLHRFKSLAHQEPEEPVRAEDVIAAEDDALDLEPIPAAGETPTIMLPRAPFTPWGSTNRYQTPNPNRHIDNRGVDKFFQSTTATEWAIAGGLFIACLGIQYYTMELPSKHLYHGMALLIWFTIAAICNGLVIWSHGSERGGDWFCGYMLELVFSVENIFVFHIVARAFRIPRRHAEKALCIVVVAQIIFEMLFFMGLAYAIRASNALPYILGVWLIYVGYQAGSEHKHEDVDFKETWVYRTSVWMFGDRLYLRYRKGDLSLIRFRGEKNAQVTLLALATMSLMIVDFCLEVDVVLTKIEEIDNHFISFTSSAVAAFAVPELFFVCRDLFARFYLMKFGICFVLVFFGFQLLTHELVEISTINQILITVVVMIICVMLSILLPAKSDLDADEEFEPVSASDGECM